MGSKYTGEFKTDALRICEREGVSTAHEKLGVPEKPLYLWQRQARLERGGVIKGLRPGETAEEGYCAHPETVDSEKWQKTNETAPRSKIRKITRRFGRSSIFHNQPGTSTHNRNEGEPCCKMPQYKRTPHQKPDQK